MECKYCNNNKKFHRAGQYTVKATGIVMERFRCAACKTTQSFERVEKRDKKYGKYLITSCQNDTDISKEQLKNLETYAKTNNAKLLILKTKLLTPHNRSYDPIWRVPEKYIVNTNIQLSDKVLLITEFNVNPSVLNPLAGLDSIANGRNVILGHPQLQMKPVPTDSVEFPLFMWTTGSLSYPNYTKTKAGYKARDNHTQSALLVDIREDKVHIRSLIADESGDFYDINGFYTGGKVKKLDRVEALVTGDEHALFFSNLVKKATYTGKKSISNILRPKRIVRHDLLDFYSGSHHHQSNYILRFKKMFTDLCNVEKELEITAQHIIETTPKDTQNLIVSSNHNDHLTKWLNACDPKIDLKNSRIYHWFMWRIFTEIEKGNEPDAFQMWFEENYSQLKDSVFFIGRDDQIELCGFDISKHGDVGVNGSRGSVMQFTKYIKSINGHTHSPAYEKGSAQVGTSTSRLEYADGLTTWSNTHGVIYANKTVQLITIIDGDWGYEH